MQKFKVVYRSGDRIKQEVGQLEFEVDETQPGNIMKIAEEKAKELIKKEKKISTFKIISCFPIK
jgi:hypothetical protein